MTVREHLSSTETVHCLFVVLSLPFEACREHSSSNATALLVFALPLSTASIGVLDRVPRVPVLGRNGRVRGSRRGRGDSSHMAPSQRVLPAQGPVRYCLCLVSPLPSWLKTLPLPCDFPLPSWLTTLPCFSTAFMAKDLCLVCVPTAFVAKNSTFPCGSPQVRHDRLRADGDASAALR